MGLYDIISGNSLDKYKTPKTNFSIGDTTGNVAKGNIAALNSVNKIKNFDIKLKTPAAAAGEAFTKKTSNSFASTAGSTAGTSVGTSGGTDKSSSGSGFNTMAMLSAAGTGIGKVMSINNSGMTKAGRQAATADAAIDTAADAAIMSGNPIAMAVGLGIKGVGAGAKAFVKTPGAIKDFTQLENVKNSSGFSGLSNASSDMLNRRNEIKNQSYSRLWSGGWKKDVMEANNLMNQQNQASGILRKNETNNLGAQSQLDFLANKINLQNSGYNLRNFSFNKNGGKLVKFRNGGSLTKKQNVIVNGKLHKELHNVKNNEDFKDAELTRKGIPVITLEDGGKAVQHAEIERDELIINLDLTKQLEGLMKLGDEKAQIEAGKLLAYELVKNTKDSKNKIIKNA